MSDDAFEHDSERFQGAAFSGGIHVDSVEARYADLFAEAIWDGTITAEKRQRLVNAADTFELTPERVAQIESALVAAHEARNQFAVVEEESRDLLGGEHPTEHDSVAPFAAADEPGMLALQKRIGVLEEQLYNADKAKKRNLEHIDALEKIVEQLQFALSSTLEELDDTHRELDAYRASAPPAPSHTQTVGATAAPSHAQTIEAPDIEEAPAPDRSIAQARTGQHEELAWDADAFSLPAHLATKRDNPDEIFRQLLIEPRNPELLHALFNALGRGEDLDRRWCIAHVLNFLGEATGPVKALAEQHASTGLVRPSRAVNDDEWRELLFHPEEDALTGEIMAAIAPAVLLGHMTAMRASIAPAVLEPDMCADPNTSTLQAVRCLAWASAFLGLDVPPLYVDPTHPGAAEIVLNPTPSTRIGAIALSGRDTRELAFIAGRHLTWYRREHLLGKPQRSTRRLEDMFLAALMIGNPGLPMTAEVKERVEPIARTTRPLLDKFTVEKLNDCFTRFVESGGRTNLSRWFRSVERTAACAGLLLANDLGAAYRMLQLDAPDRASSDLDELICSLTAGRCTLLRKRIGIAVA